jgi:hypothetical protein
VPLPQPPTSARAATNTALSETRGAGTVGKE